MIGEKLVPALNESTTLLLRAIGQFTSHSFNQPGSGNNWSAGQIAEHILLTDLFIARLLQQDLQFAGRSSDEKLEAIRALFQDNQDQVPVSSFAEPSDMLKDPAAIQQKIGRERQLIITCINAVEEDALCGGYSHPILGTLTITEWIWYIVFNTQRYLRELADFNPDN